MHTPSRDGEIFLACTGGADSMTKPQKGCDTALWSFLKDQEPMVDGYCGKAAKEVVLSILLVSSDVF